MGVPHGESTVPPRPDFLLATREGGITRRVWPRGFLADPILKHEIGSHEVPPARKTVRVPQDVTV